MRVALMLVGLLAFQEAGAFSFGITGRSGNPATGSFCSACHGGGTNPKVEILGPSVVRPGSTHTFTLRIRGGQQTAGGLDVSATAGALAVSDPGTRLASGEITHNAPRPAIAGDVVFTFNWTAPADPGSATLYGAGNSVNSNGSPTGDAPGRAVYRIEVDPDARVPVRSFPPPALVRTGSYPTRPANRR